jgi:hypothetical protein
MKNYWIAGLAMLVSLAPELPGAEVAVSLPQEIEACALTLTDLGSHARFADSAVFALESKADGGMPSVVVERPPRSGWQFLSLSEVKGCLTRWRVPPRSQYKVVLQFGTTEELLSRWAISVTSGGRELTRVILPRGRAQE